MDIQLMIMHWELSNVTSMESMWGVDCLRLRALPVKNNGISSQRHVYNRRASSGTSALNRPSLQVVREYPQQGNVTGADSDRSLRLSSGGCCVCCLLGGGMA